MVPLSSGIVCGWACARFTQRIKKRVFSGHLVLDMASQYLCGFSRHELLALGRSPDNATIARFEKSDFQVRKRIRFSRT